MLQWYPVHYRVSAAPVVTLAMVVIAVLGGFLLPGSALILWPLYLCMPLICLLHVLLFLDDDAMGKLDALFFALVHLPLAFVIWTFSLLHVSGTLIF